ncbi:unnamed protein product [Symbiodinium sp. CCMP2592]|nr:unnamed protein product [Symbiodinium sp. CCMP2592]
MWFADMLYAMESLVPYIGNIDRVQEDCDVLTLTLAKYEKVNLKEFRSVMFASLRSLLPTTWSSEHENAWAWFWGIVEKKVEENKQLPVHNHQCLRSFLARMDEETLADFKLKVFDTFFATTEESQLYLRAANKRLMYIMGRILTIMSDIYTKTHQAVIALSALGLLHAGHGVPEDLVRPFVQAFMGGIKENCPDESLHDGLWWTLDLIGRIFIRTLAEGSTPVIIAINRNTSKAMKTAVANYPRGEREVILLKVQVGTESMSPLIWAVEKGALDSAKEILNDLLTMRADRARYYYGMETLFTRHSDIISLLCTKAPSLLPTLFDGLIWRSKNVKNGLRRANYYIASLLRDENGQLTDSLLDLIKQGDPEIICHPTVVFQADLLWTRLCCLPWALTKCWFCLTLVLFVMAEQQAIVSSDSLSTDRFTVIACRALLYVCSLGQLFAKHAFQTYRAVRQKEMMRYCCMPVPKYVLRTRQELIEVLLLLLLLCLLCIEPALHCLAVSSEFLIDCCAHGEWQCNLMHTYNRLAAFPMMLYFILASELVHLNVHLSVFSVICSSLMWEFILYVAVLIFFTAAFASAVACLPQSMGSDSVQMRDFFSWPLAFESLLSMAFNTYGSDNYEQIAQEDEPMLKWFVMGFAACWHVYLMNLMVAQLCQRYNEIFHDARGNARLTRGINIYETSMPLISKKRWTGFVESLHLEEACELDEGDNGPRGAVPTTEDPYDYLQYPKVTLDRVQRYGGLANPELPWPSLEEAIDDSAVGKLTRMTQAKFEEMDRLMVDMAIKLQVRPPGTAGGTNTFAASHASQQSQQRDESKQVDHDHDPDALKESTEDVADELGLNERTANELLEERTEDGDMRQLRNQPSGFVNITKAAAASQQLLLAWHATISMPLFQDLANTAFPDVSERLAQVFADTELQEQVAQKEQSLKEAEESKTLLTTQLAEAAEANESSTSAKLAAEKEVEELKEAGKLLQDQLLEAQETSKRLEAELTTSKESLDALETKLKDSQDIKAQEEAAATKEELVSTKEALAASEAKLEDNSGFLGQEEDYMATSRHVAAGVMERYGNSQLQSDKYKIAATSSLRALPFPPRCSLKSPLESE